MTDTIQSPEVTLGSRLGAISSETELMMLGALKPSEMITKTDLVERINGAFDEIDGWEPSHHLFRYKVASKFLGPIDFLKVDKTARPHETGFTEAGRMHARPWAGHLWNIMEGTDVPLQTLIGGIQLPGTKRNMTVFAQDVRFALIETIVRSEKSRMGIAEVRDETAERHDITPHAVDRHINTMIKKGLLLGRDAVIGRGSKQEVYRRAEGAESALAALLEFAPNATNAMVLRAALEADDEFGSSLITDETVEAAGLVSTRSTRSRASTAFRVLARQGLIVEIPGATRKTFTKFEVPDNVGAIFDQLTAARLVSLDPTNTFRSKGHEYADGILDDPSKIPAMIEKANKGSGFIEPVELEERVEQVQSILNGSGKSVPTAEIAERLGVSIQHLSHNILPNVPGVVVKSEGARNYAQIIS